MARADVRQDLRQSDGALVSLPDFSFADEGEKANFTRVDRG